MLESMNMTSWELDEGLPVEVEEEEVAGEWELNRRVSRIEK
jgi:hypothetical protein